MKGWECPVCHVGVAPHLYVCPECVKKSTEIVTSSGYNPFDDTQSQVSTSHTLKTRYVPIKWSEFPNWYQIDGINLP